MAAHSSILAWKIPWTEEPGKLQSTGLQRAGHDWVSMYTGLYEETHFLHIFKENGQYLFILTK